MLTLFFIFTGETFTMTYKDFSAVYPNYLDSDKTVKLGRRIAAKDAVSEPTIQDIHEALISLDIRHVIQPHKGYSRDASSRWDNPGRVMVDLEGAVEIGILDMCSNGEFDLNDDIPEMGDGGDDHADKENKEGGRGKKQLLRQLARIILDLPNRQKRLEAKNKMLEEEKLQVANAEKVATKTKTGGGSSGGAGNRKKKGKKKK